MSAPYANSTTVKHITEVGSFDELIGHAAATRVLRINRGLPHSVIGTLVLDHNPFVQVPTLRNLTSNDTTQQLADS